MLFYCPKKMRVFSSGLVLLLLAGLMLGCGWRLRGAVDLPAGMSEIYLQGENRHGDFSRALSSLLSGSDARLVDSKHTAALVLVITKNSSNKRVLSLDNTGVANEYELQYQLGYLVQDNAGKPLLAGRTIHLQRSFRFDATQILAGKKEEQRLRSEMMSQAISQMLRQIAAQLRTNTV